MTSVNFRLLTPALSEIINIKCSINWKDQISRSYTNQRRHLVGLIYLWLTCCLVPTSNKKWFVFNELSFSRNNLFHRGKLSHLNTKIYILNFYHIRSMNKLNLLRINFLAENISFKIDVYKWLCFFNHEKTQNAHNSAY